MKRIINKIRNKFNYTVVSPMPYDQQMSDAYNGISVTNGETKGKTAVVTGATGEIGFAITKRLLLEGCNIILVGRDQNKLDIANDSLSQFSKSQTIVSYTMNMMDFDDVIWKTELILKENNIDIWVNNAGIFKKKDRYPAFRSYPKQDIIEEFDTNLKSYYIICKIIGERMRAKSNFCHIINISSICGFTKSMGYTGYGMSKASVIRMTKKLAKEYGDCASISSIAPGSVATRMGDRKFGDNIGVNENMITKHIAMPEEIASLAAFLSGNMGLYLNGETVIASADETL